MRLPDFRAMHAFVQPMLGAQRMLQLRRDLLALVAREAVHDACTSGGSSSSGRQRAMTRHSSSCGAWAEVAPLCTRPWRPVKRAAMSAAISPMHAVFFFTFTSYLPVAQPLPALMLAGAMLRLVQT